MENIIKAFKEIQCIFETNTRLRIIVNLIAGVIGLILVCIMFNSIININKKKNKKSNNNGCSNCGQKEKEQLRHISEWDYDYLKNYLDVEMVKHPHELSCDIATVLMDFKNDGDEQDKEIKSICEQYSELKSSYERKIKSLNGQLNSTKEVAKTIHAESNNMRSKLEQQNALLQDENTNLKRDNSRLTNDAASLMKENEYLHKSYDRVLEEMDKLTKLYSSGVVVDEIQDCTDLAATYKFNTDAFNKVPDKTDEDSKDEEIQDEEIQVNDQALWVPENTYAENDDNKSFDEIYGEVMHKLEIIKEKHNLGGNNA